MSARGLMVAHTTGCRPRAALRAELNRRMRPHLKLSGISDRLAERRIEGVEALHLLRQGQVNRIVGRAVGGQANFVQSMFDVAV
jgi:hypothetical protein